MSALADVVGLDFYLVQKHLRKLRGMERLELRRAYLRGVGLEDGQRVHDLTKAALLEVWADERQHQSPPSPPEDPCAST